MLNIVTNLNKINRNGLDYQRGFTSFLTLYVTYLKTKVHCAQEILATILRCRFQKYCYEQMELMAKIMGSTYKYNQPSHVTSH